MDGLIEHIKHLHFSFKPKIVPLQTELLIWLNSFELTNIWGEGGDRGHYQYWLEPKPTPHTKVIILGTLDCC